MQPTICFFVALGFLAGATALQADGLGSFYRSLSTTPYGYRIVPDPTGSASAPTVQRFEVRPGDCGETRGLSDCATDRERSELAQDRSNRIRPNTESWYGWSLYLPDDFPNVFPTKTVLGQFHQTASNPVFMFLHTADGLVLANHLARGAKDLLIPEEDLRGAWHKVEVHARWSRMPDGFFRVYVAGVLRSEYRGVTMTAREVYLKYGVYRSFVSRYWNAIGVRDVPTQIAFFSGVTAARAREGLFDAAQ